jgi:hypothetical protein
MKCKNKKLLLVLTIVLVIVLLTISLTIFFNRKLDTIQYNCGKASVDEIYGRTDIYYLEQNGKKIHKQQITEFYYNDKDLYQNDKNQLLNHPNILFDDDKLTIKIGWGDETILDKKINVVLKEIENLGYTCKKIVEEEK